MLEDKPVSPCLSYCIINNTLYVAHPYIMPHAVNYVNGDWYIYPVSPELEKFKEAKFTHGDWKACLGKE